MALSIGIVGLPNVGKSTLFNALADAKALIANYPFATIEPNTGVVPIPDSRLNKLAAIYKTDKIVPATVQFVDIAGLVSGASKGEGLGNQFLSHIRSTNAICHVVRAFDDPNINREHSSDPQNDIEIINTELVLADLQTVGNRLPRLEKESRANPKLKPAYDALKQVSDLLESGKPIHPEEGIDQEHLADLFLLSAKPVIYAFNVDEVGLKDKESQASLSRFASPAKSLFICAKLESELRGLDEKDRQELLESYGQKKSGLIQLIHAAYSVLGLQSFLTAGEKSSSAKASEGLGEVRAWTISKGATAPQAAGVIHSDFERGFIAAQVVDYEDLVAAGSLPAAKAAGKVRTEGKDYIMRPNDVVEFKFNV